MEPVGKIDYRTAPDVTDEALNELFASAWRDYVPRAFRPILDRSLTYVCAFDGPRLVGFVNVAWDGGVHGFVLDTTVHADYRRGGIGRRLVQAAADVARQHGVHWLHVDYEPHLDAFYRGCGFRRSEAGLLDLRVRSE